VAGAPRAQVRPLDELVLQLPHVRVLWLELDLLPSAGADRVDRLTGLVERVLLRPAPELEDAGQGGRDL